MSTRAGGELERALEQLVQRAVENGLAQLRQEMARVATGLAAGGHATASPAPTPGRSLASLSQAVSGILQPAGQTEIMAATLKASAALTPRVALLVRRGDNFSLWRAEGLSHQETSSLRGLMLSGSTPGMLRELCDHQQPILRQRTPGALPPALELSAGGSVALLPIVVHGKVVAALFSDASVGAEEMGGLEVLARVAGLSLETASRRAASSEAPRAAEIRSPATPPEPVRAESQPLEVEPATAVTSMLPESAPSPSDGAAPASEPAPGSFAASTPPSVTTVSPLLPAPPDVDSLPEAERESHRKAHRFARVAVQDLMSYHKDKIAEGRRNRNLFLLLKDDIEKTRENYQKRFGNTPAQVFDYLHYEMVAKLAENDPGVLGDQYPGPRTG